MSHGIQIFLGELKSEANPIIASVNAELIRVDKKHPNEGNIHYRFAIGKECAFSLRQRTKDVEEKERFAEILGLS